MDNNAFSSLQLLRIEFAPMHDSLFFVDYDLHDQFIAGRSEEHTSELQSPEAISYAVFLRADDVAPSVRCRN